MLAVLPAVTVAGVGLRSAWLLRASRGWSLVLGVAFGHAPMLACAGYTDVAQQPDGSYECFNT